MSRWTLGNVAKVGLVVLFLPFLAFLVLLIGAVKKKLWVGIEGLIYAAGFAVGIFVLDVIGLGGLLALASMGASGVRSWHLRDLWLPTRRRWWHRFLPAEEKEPLPELPPEPSDELSTALISVGSRAREHRLQLPSSAYTSLMKTCQLLAAVVEAEKRDPSGDARLEYELDAMVQQYLPAVVQGYLAIPPTMTNTRQPNGRTPNEELVEQLDLLSGQAQALHAGRHSRATAQLTTTGNFLREKFGHRSQDAFEFGVK